MKYKFTFQEIEDLVEFLHWTNTVRISLLWRVKRLKRRRLKSLQKFHSSAVGRLHSRAYKGMDLITLILTCLHWRDKFSCNIWNSPMRQNTVLGIWVSFISPFYAWMTPIQHFMKTTLKWHLNHNIFFSKSSLVKKFLHFCHTVQHAGS